MLLLAFMSLVQTYAHKHTHTQLFLQSKIIFQKKNKLFKFPILEYFRFLLVYFVFVFVLFL